MNDLSSTVAAMGLNITCLPFSTYLSPILSDTKVDLFMKGGPPPPTPEQETLTMNKCC